MKNFLKAPLSNLLGILLAIAIPVVMLYAGAVGLNQAQLAPLSLSGGNSSITGNLAVSGNTTVGGNATVTGNLTAATLQTGVETYSGTVHFGSATSVTSGTTVLHGFTTTPTSFIVIENGIQSSTVFSQSLYAFNCNTTTCAIGVSQGTIASFTINWMAGK